MAIYSDRELQAIMEENGIKDTVKKNIGNIKDAKNGLLKSAKDNFDSNIEGIKDKLPSKKKGTKMLKVTKEDVEQIEEANKLVKIGSKIFRPLTKAEEKEQGVAFKDAITIQGKKYIYKCEEDIRDNLRHPTGFLGDKTGSAIGGAVGGATLGVPGAAVGSAVGGFTGRVIGNAIGSTKTGSKVEKVPNKVLDKTYKKMKEDVDFRDVYRTPEFTKAMNEYFDITDNETRKILLSVNEDDQNRVLISLTSKLYDNIVDKVDDIDFGEIPSTKGDITKLSNYDKMLECASTMTKILIEFKQDLAPITSITDAIGNIIESTPLWKKGFALNAELPMLMYNTIVLAIIEALTYMVSMCIEFVKTPSQDTFQITIDRSALVKTKDHLVFENLNKFNEAYRKGQITNSVEYVIKGNVKNLMGEIGVGTAAAGIIGLLFCIIPILRELIFLFYYNRVRISEYFDMQADMLQINAYNVEHNRLDLDKEQKQNITKKQLTIAEKFRKFANKVSIKMKESEVKASKDITQQNKKYKADEVMDELPDSAASSLF